jgi:hypothetical protein
MGFEPTASPLRTRRSPLKHDSRGGKEVEEVKEGRGGKGSRSPVLAGLRKTPSKRSLGHPANGPLQTDVAMPGMSGPEFAEELAPCEVLESALISTGTADDLRSLPDVVNESRKR